MVRLLLTGLLATVLSAAVLPAEAADRGAGGTCDAPFPSASYSQDALRAVRVAHQASPDPEPEATLRSALHRCVLPLPSGRTVRARTYRF